MCSGYAIGSLLLASCLVTVVARAKDTPDARHRARKAAEAKFQLRIDREGWGEASHADLSAVLHSACAELAVHFGDDTELDPIRVMHHKSGPIVLFQRSLRDEIMMRLSSKGLYWGQHAYQVSHEFCHVLCGFKEGDRTNLWFEEALCEMASIFALREMAKTWATHPPYPNWRDFAKSFRDYADDVAKKHALPPHADFTRWYRKNADALAKNATDRGRNAKVAVRLLPLFEKNPRNWRVIAYLNVGRGDELQSFDEFLGNWAASCPGELREIVVRIGLLFGIVVEDSPL